MAVAIGLLIVAAGLAVSTLSIGRSGVGQPSVGASPTHVAETREPERSPTASPTPLVSPTPEPEQLPTPTPLPSGPATIAWAQGDAHGGWIRDVVRHGGRWIAGGAVQMGDFYRAATWTSLDGRTWSGPIALPPEPVPDSDGMHPRYWINGFGVLDGTLLAFGWNGVGCCDGGFPMMWRSDDGEIWSVVNTAGSAFGDSYHSPQTSVSTPQGNLAVLTATGLGSGASIFLTGDLVSWEEYSFTELEPYTVSGLAASPTLLIAVGTEHLSYEAGEDPPTTAHAWTSTDGRTWTAVTAPNPDGTLDSVTWDPSRDRFVAVGTDDDGAPAAWLTADGSGWSWIPLADETGRMQDVAAADGLIVASGNVGPTFEPSGETIAWTSHDGVTWLVMPLLDRQRGSVVGAESGSAVMIINDSDEAGGDSWQSWAGPVQR